MKHYEKLLELGCFSKNDLEQITGSEAAAKWLCREYQKKGYIERVKRDLYVAISLENQQPIANRYVIASHISNDAAVSYHSAFEFYGYSNPALRARCILSFDTHGKAIWPQLRCR